MNRKYVLQSILVLLITAIILIIVVFVFSRSFSYMFAENFAETYSDASSVAADKFYSETNDGKTLTEAATAAPLGKFEQLIVLTEGGGVEYSTKGNIVGAFVSGLSPLSVEKFKAGEAFYAEEIINGSDCLLFVAEKNAETNYRVACYVTFAARDAAIGEYTNGVFLYMGITAAVLCVCFGTLCAVYKHRNDFLTQSMSGVNYIFSLDKKENIVKSNAFFRKEFAADTLRGAVLDNTNLEFAAKKGMAVAFSLTDKADNLRYLTGIPVKASGGVKIIASDTTENTSAFIKSMHDSVTDKLTGLANQKLFESKWEAVRAAGKITDCAVADINVGSRSYYEALVGTNSVEKILRLYAEILKKETEPYGELFALENGDIMLFITDKKKRYDFVKNLLVFAKEINKPVKFNGEMYKPDSNVGVVVTDSCPYEITAENLLYNTRLALQNAVKNNNSGVYILRTDKFSSVRLDVTQDGLIEKMLEDGDIEVYFQPQYDVQKNRICGFEALSRIKGDKGRQINVEQLYAVADKYGGITALGKYVMHEVVEFVKMVGHSGITVSVNVSPAQIMQMGFVGDIMGEIERAGIAPTSVCVEIVENTVINSFNDIVKKLNLLREKGVGVHLDDFGVAYSSMLYLKKLPLTALKIDRAFLDGITTDKQSFALVKFIVSLAKDLNLECICEGVETEEVSDAVQKAGCRIIQGYLYGRAVKVDEAVNLLKEKNNL